MAVDSVRPWAAASANTSYPGEGKPRATLSSHAEMKQFHSEAATADTTVKHNTSIVVLEAAHRGHRGHQPQTTDSRSMLGPVRRINILLPRPQPLQALTEMVIEKEIQRLHTLIQGLFQGHR